MFIIGFGIITYLLGLNILPFSILVIFIISIILSAFVITKEKYNHFPFTLDSLVLIIVIIVPTFTDFATTPEFSVNYPHSSEITIILLSIGAARILIGIWFTDYEMGFISRIKNRIYGVWSYFKKDPFLYLVIGISIFFFIIFINLCCWCLGLIPSTSSFFSFYIFILTKVIFVNSTISLVLLAFTKPKDLHNIIGMSIWLPVVLIPSVFFYYFFYTAWITK